MNYDYEKPNLTKNSIALGGKKLSNTMERPVSRHSFISLMKKMQHMTSWTTHLSSFPQQLGLRLLPARSCEMKLSGLPVPLCPSDPKQRTDSSINKNASVQIQVQ